MSEIPPVAPELPASLPPTTTAEEQLTIAGQRRINLIWEYTQAVVTVVITCASIYCAVNKVDADVVNYAFIAVVSTYYARTNHTRIGGVGISGVKYISEGR